MVVNDRSMTIIVDGISPIPTALCVGQIGISAPLSVIHVRQIRSTLSDIAIYNFLIIERKFPVTTIGCSLRSPICFVYVFFLLLCAIKVNAKH